MIADGPSTSMGELALGKNPLIGFMTWGRQLRLSLGSNLAHQNISRPDLGTDTDNSSVVFPEQSVQLL